MLVNIYVDYKRVGLLIMLYCKNFKKTEVKSIFKLVFVFFLIGQVFACICLFLEMMQII